MGPRERRRTSTTRTSAARLHAFTRTLAGSLAVVVALSSLGRAQTLPFRHYSVPEGLANSRVNFVFQDSRGYFWFGTWEGLSRFDGAEFRNYGTAEGLPTFLVNAVAEDDRGRIWIATQGGGIARLLERDEFPPSPAGGQPRTMFESHSVGETRESNIVVGITFDGRGNIWCGTEAGIFRAPLTGASDLRFEQVVANESVDSAQFACTDERGGFWASTRSGILELEGSRILARLTPPAPWSELREPIALLPRPGGVLAVYGKDLFEIDRAPSADSPPTWRRVPLSIAPTEEIRCALLASKGTLWLGTTSGLIRWRDGVASDLTTANGLPDISIRSLCEDRDHDLWMGTWSSGAVKLASEAFVNFVLLEAMPDRNAIRVVEAHDGSIYASGKVGIVRVHDDHAEIVPGSMDPPFDGVGLRILQDRRGDFWIGTIHGLFRFPGPNLEMHDGRAFTEADGVVQAEVFGTIYEDPRGKIWVGFPDGKLLGWDSEKSSTPHFEPIAIRDPLGILPPREFLHDSRGQFWLAPYVGLARLVGDEMRRLEPSEGLPDLQTRCLFEDRRGRLWIGTRFHGVSVTEEPAAERPRFRNYSTKNGLASDAVWSIAEDDLGQMYFATSRGMERLDVDTGRVRHITSFDGLAGDIVNHLIKDRRGNIWAATSGGLSRYDPRAEPPPTDPPPTYISRVRIAGDDIPISETGERSVPDVTLPASKDNLLIEFIGISFRGEREVAYQYQLEGADPEWSAPSPQRSVNYAHLAPGDYRFLVRATHASGTRSAEPASFAFRILRPYWQQAWFLAGTTALFAAIAAGIAYAIHRSRLKRILALEGIRTQIATDIHDDMGSGLSQIAILTEVAKREAPLAAQRYLEEVARLARSMRDSMSDIVWSVDPRRDRFGDLVQRMRQAAFNLLEAEGLRVEFRAPPDAKLEDVGLAPDRRRHLLLILKESLSNVARHARASEILVEIRVESGRLRLRIQDDGSGFDVGTATGGHGLSNLRQRTAKLSGTIRIASEPGAGTTIDVSVPV